MNSTTTTTATSSKITETTEYYLGEGLYMDFSSRREYLIAKDKMYPKKPLPTPTPVITTPTPVITTPTPVITTPTHKPYEFARNVMKHLDFAKCMEKNVLHKAEHKKKIVRKFASHLIFAPLHLKTAINTTMDIRKHLEKVIFREITTIKSKEDKQDIRDEIYTDCEYVFDVQNHDWEYRLEFKKGASLKRMLAWVDKYSWCFIDSRTCCLGNSVSQGEFKTLFDISTLHNPEAQKRYSRVKGCNYDLMLDDKIWKYCYYSYKCANKITDW